VSNSRQPVYADPESARGTALAFLRSRVPNDEPLSAAKDRHIKEAARLAQVHPQQLAHWAGASFGQAEVSGEPLPTDLHWGSAADEADDEDRDEADYYLPEDVADPCRETLLFAPAHRLGQWARETMIDAGGALEQGHHWHLRAARIGWLWTNVLDAKGGRMVVGRAELVGTRGNKWQTGRDQWLLTRWFGSVPHFVITLDAPAAALADDASFCSTVYHELLHCSYKVDEFGIPKETPDGDFIWDIRGHDAEEMRDCVALFGVAAAAAGVGDLVSAAAKRPVFSAEEIAAACAPLRRDDSPY
jgi:hypothetical protein